MLIDLSYNDNKLFFKSTPDEWIVFRGYNKLEFKSGKRKGQTQEVMIDPKYFSYFLNAIHYLLECHLRASDARALLEFANDYKQLKQFIINQFKEKK